ncbi:MAG: FHA domain-containing protein [Pseudomonadota bacterium]
MQGIRNLIARRRPTASGGEEAAVPDTTEHAAGREGASAIESTVPAVLSPQTMELPKPADMEAATLFEKADFLARAIDARDHIPSSEIPVQQGYKVLSGRRITRPSTESAPEERPGSRPVRARKIWDVDPPEPQSAPPETSAGKLQSRRTSMAPPDAAAQEAPVAHVAPPASKRPQSSRAKTRLLGFHAGEPAKDIFAGDAASGAAGTGSFPIGWLVLVDGPGRGASFTLHAGLSTVGRDPDQTISLDFGDAAISRSQHIAIAYDSEENRTFIGHGGKQNIVRLNGKPLLTTEALGDRDEIKIGKSTLRFIALCDASFSWDEQTGDADE